MSMANALEVAIVSEGRGGAAAGDALEPFLDNDNVFSGTTRYSGSSEDSQQTDKVHDIDVQIDPIVSPPCRETRSASSTV